MSQQPIENYGVIGDMHTVALVGMDGSIDFMCLPRFDSPSVFAALLDPDRGGRFQIAPRLPGARRTQLYLPDTNILLTRFLARTGVAEVSDFMPVTSPDGARRVVRRVKCVRGKVRFALICAPRFDYARAAGRVEQSDGCVVFTSTGADATALCLRTPLELELGGQGDAATEFTLSGGETAAFVLEEAYPGMESPAAAADFVSQAFKDTADYWRAWVARSTYRGRWRDMVHRSALTLKLLTCEEQGAIVAAPTFGLPEVIGGERNWDYRYTWIRDAAFSLYALMRIGYTEEAAAFARWLSDRWAEPGPHGDLQIMYGLDGRHRLEEETLEHLSGFRDSAPVRIGNAAYDQLQLDIYGALLDAIYLADKYGEQISHDLWGHVSGTVEWLRENWHRQDEGIWEMRSGRREFLSSRLMCWVALDRAVRLARKRGLPAPLQDWQATRNAIYRDIHENFWDPEQGAFMQSKGGQALDASALLMPLLRFIAPTDPRWRSTQAAIGARLSEDAFVYRYNAEASPDALAGKEGAFTMCSFWYVECLARSGEVKQARLLFEKMLGYANHLGLYAEELGPRAEHLGNFPQALTHLGLISAAHYLDRTL